MKANYEKNIEKFSYSTEEQVIGKTNDSKTVYKKTFDLDITNSPVATWVNVGNISNIDKVIDISKVIEDPRSDYGGFFDTPTGAGCQIPVSIWINHSGEIKYACFTEPLPDCILHITIKYTKTAD